MNTETLDAVFALLKLATDPEGTQKRLTELAEQSKTLAEAQSELDAARDAFEHDRQEFRAEKQNTLNEISVRKSEVDGMMSEATKRNAVYDEREQRLHTREQALDKREPAVGDVNWQRQRASLLTPEPLPIAPKRSRPSTRTVSPSCARRRCKNESS